MKNEEALRQIEASMRAVGRQGRTVFTQTHFEIFISASQDDYLSFAVPLAAPSAELPQAIADMQVIFARHHKRPRLEYIANLHPELAPMLEQAGLACESRAPIMILDMANLGPPASPSLTHYQKLATADESFLKTFLMGQSIAYGGSGGEESLGWLPHLQQGLANGSVMGGALMEAADIRSGAIIQIGEGIGELAGVWSAPSHRRRGLAYALCRQLLAEYRAAGYSVCWLSAAEGAQRLYEKLGFIPAGVQLNFGAPPAS